MLVLPLIAALLPLAQSAPPLTNAERFARGLSPLKPNLRARQQPSGVPTVQQKGFLYAVQDSALAARDTSYTGCVISDGTWYVGGTCATYTAQVTGDKATLSTSKGPCAINAGALSCASGNTAAVFGLNADGTLSYASSTLFSADKVPASGTRQTVYAGRSHALPLKLSFTASTTTPTSTSSTSVAPSKTSSAVYPTGTGLTVCSSQDVSSFPMSCSSANVDNTCCTDSPGGHLLLTQFWDTGASSTGPNNSWTLHGLWPDNCDGSYEQYCDKSREYTNITQILQANHQTDLLAYMDKYWKDYQGNDESFWEHEFNKHGTCMSSLVPTCFNNYYPQQDVVVYFNRAVELFKTLPSYEWLASDGIVPSLTATYTLKQIQDSLTKHHGHPVNVNCKGNVFEEIWYHYRSQGGAASGNIIPHDPVGSPSTCPSTGIRYYPKYVSI